MKPIAKFSSVTYNTIAYRSEWPGMSFRCGGGLQNWLHTDAPLTERNAWFPYCVYVRYIKRPTIIPNSQRSHSQNGGRNVGLSVFQTMCDSEVQKDCLLFLVHIQCVLYLYITASDTSSSSSFTWYTNLANANNTSRSNAMIWVCLHLSQQL